MRLLSTLYVTGHRSRVTADHRALIVTAEDGTRTRVPIESVDSVVLLGHSQVTGEALTVCTRSAVRVAALQRSGRVRYCVGGGVSGNVLLRLAQYRHSESGESSLSLSRCIVAGKLQNARHLVQRWRWDAKVERQRARLHWIDGAIVDRISALQDARTTDHVRGLEGEGARLYFEAMRLHLRNTRWSHTFEVRSRRPPRDPLNAALSFAYGLLVTMISGALESVGLDPQVGFLHVARPGRPALALDILEEMRPGIADRFVVGAFSRRELTNEDFIVTTGGACYLSDAGRARFIEAWESYKSAETRHLLLDRQLAIASLPLVQAILMARHLRGDLPAYPPYLLTS